MLSVEVINDVDKIIAQIDINGVEVSLIVPKILYYMETVKAERYYRGKSAELMRKISNQGTQIQRPFFSGRTLRKIKP